MNLSSFFIRTLLLLLPGIISRLIYRKLIGKRNNKDWEDFAEVLLFSMLCYIIYGFVTSVTASSTFTVPTIFDSFYDPTIPLQWNQIFGTSLVALILPYLASYLHTYKVFNKLGQWIRATKHFGDEDVWDLLHHESDAQLVFVRDHKLNLVYYGWIRAFSDLQQKRELLLENVDVYTNKGKHLYKCPTMYVSRDQYDLSIEVVDPNQSPEQQSNEKEA